MRYPPSLLDEIRARVPVSSVVGRRVKLKKAGREMKGLSPFQAEKSPSFFVNDAKGFYHDFSSGKHGDVFRFLMETEGLSFPEAVERLAGEAGVALPTVSREAEREEVRRKGLHEVVELAARFFEASLASPAAAHARAYLDRRGITPDQRRAFRLGYAPGGRQALRRHLAGEGVEVGMAVEAGLLVSGDDVPEPFDRFRDRVTFAIEDLRGRAVGFGARALAADVPAKYLNSPETPLFDKGRLLYNGHRARGPARDKGRVIAVEGYVDALAMATFGFPETVAPLGTALTEGQLALLWRMADEPILCFDGDGAGRRAADRAAEVALPALAPGKSLRFAFLPDGLDPDDLLRRSGPAEMERHLGLARPLAEVLWTREVEAAPHATPEERAGLETRLLALAAQVGDPTARRYYEAGFRQRLRELLYAARPAFVPGKRRGTDASEHPSDKLPAAAAGSALSRSRMFEAGGRGGARQAAIALLATAHPDLLGGLAEEVAGLTLTDPDAVAVVSGLLDALAHDRAPSLDPGGALGEGIARLTRRLQRRERDLLRPDADPLAAETTLRQAIDLHRRAHGLHAELCDAEREMAEDLTEATYARVRELNLQIETLDGLEASLAEAAGEDAPSALLDAEHAASIGFDEG